MGGVSATRGGTIAVVLLGATAGARAEPHSFLEIVGGAALPVGDRTWSASVETSPKLAGHAGGMVHGIGVAVSGDVTLVRSAAGTTLFPPTGQRDTFHRFRLLADLYVAREVAPQLTVTARIGAGVDIAATSYDLPSQAYDLAESNTDVGLAFEAGAGIWRQVGVGLQLGGELAVPVGQHAWKGTGFALDYTSFELDVLVGLRVISTR